MHRGVIIASPDLHGHNVAPEFMNRASHISKLSPNGAVALGRGVGFDVQGGVMETAAK